MYQTYVKGDETVILGSDTLARVHGRPTTSNIHTDQRHIHNFVNNYTPIYLMHTRSKLKSRVHTQLLKLTSIHKLKNTSTNTKTKTHTNTNINTNTNKTIKILALYSVIVIGYLT